VSAQDGDAGQSRGYSFGAFKGVFTPSILTILGVVMYLRFGWVLGQVGLPLTLLIVTMATAITFLTSLSLSATATNMRVGGGGAYYIISRSLGIEIGAAIGVPLFLAQSIGVAFYITGFAEALSGTVDIGHLLDRLPFAITEVRLIAVLTLLALGVLAAVSADLALKTQMFILMAIVISLLSFFLGGPPKDDFVKSVVDISDPVSF
jgi:solute carrier family 12 (sodium/potassium/chloride transporter), member 2